VPPLATRRSRLFITLDVRRPLILLCLAAFILLFFAIRKANPALTPEAIVSPARWPARCRPDEETTAARQAHQSRCSPSGTALIAPLLPAPSRKMNVAPGQIFRPPMRELRLHRTTSKNCITIRHRRPGNFTFKHNRGHSIARRSLLEKKTLGDQRYAPAATHRHGALRLSRRPSGLHSRFRAARKSRRSRRGRITASSRMAAARQSPTQPGQASESIFGRKILPREQRTYG